MSFATNGTSQGTAPAGSAPAGNPLQVGGVTSGNVMRALLVAADGTLQVSGTGGGVVTQPTASLLNATVILAAGSAAVGTVGVTALPSLPAGANAIGSVSVSNFPATQPISAVALPLPTGASTAAKQPALGTAGTASADVITIQGITSMTPLQVAGTVTAANASVSATGSAVPASATMAGGTDGTNLRAILTDTSGRQVVNVNGTVPVSGTFFQVTQPVSGTFFQTTQPVSLTTLPALTAGSAVIGHVIADSGSTTAVTGNVTVTQATGTNLHVVVDSAPSTAVTGTVTANLGTLNGAATAANQTNVQGTAGSPASTVLSVQGVAGGTAQPVSGTVTANVGTTNGLALDATLTGGTQQTKITDGTTIAAVAPATGSQTTQTYQQVGPTFQSQAFSVSAAGNGTAYDAGGYATVKVQILTTYTGSSGITFQCSNDGANWQNVLLSLSNGAIQSVINSAGLLQGALTGRYFRLMFAGTQSAGSTTGTIVFSTASTAYVQTNVSAVQSGTWTVGLSAGATVQPGNTANTTPWLVNALLNPSGTLLNTYSVHLTTNATTTPTASTAYISSLTISAEVGGTTSTVTIQDKQGTPLKLVNGLATTALTTTPTTVNFQTPVKMVSGIDIITAGAVAATVDVWINYYQ